ncbi:MAG: imidazole glycerol phosphate synthase subunit HisH [Clostridia bacterium]|nr:imidazole glycerol phosphate synthase subunit HisH [Clostridia bacterium]
MTITIIDYGAGNLRSVEKAFLYLGYDVDVTSDPEKIASAKKLVLPGVGSFRDAMDSLKAHSLVEPIKAAIKAKTPFLGICLGMQMMYDFSEEGDAEGLGILKGTIRRFSDDIGLKIPQIGWNSLEIKRPSVLLNSLGEQPFVYFVHSYYLEAEEPETVVATTHYGIHPHVLIEKDNIFLCQFHPEKSGETGLKMLKNFAEYSPEDLK